MRTPDRILTKKNIVESMETLTPFFIVVSFLLVFGFGVFIGAAFFGQ